MVMSGIMMLMTLMACCFRKSELMVDSVLNNQTSSSYDHCMQQYTFIGGDADQFKMYGTIYTALPRYTLCSPSQTVPL